MTTTPHRIRRGNAEFHKTTLRQNRGYATEQGKVWEHVANMSHEMAAPTMTGAMNDVLEQREGSIEEYRQGISLDGAGTGAAFFFSAFGK